MSNRTARRLVSWSSLVVLTLGLTGHATQAQALEINELPLTFSQDAPGAELSADIADLPSLEEGDQIVLELVLNAEGVPDEEDLLLEFRLVCGPEGDEVELFGGMDLFPDADGNDGRQVLVDLTSLSVLDLSPCASGEAKLRLTALGEGAQISQREDSDAKIQIVRY